MFFNDPLSRAMPHTGATRHVQWTHSTVDDIYIAQQHSHGHVTYPLLVIRGCRARSGHPGRAHVQRPKAASGRARGAACQKRPGCRTRAAPETTADPAGKRWRCAQPERPAKMCGPQRGHSAAPPQSQNAPARPTRLRLAVSATCQQGFKQKVRSFGRASKVQVAWKVSLAAGRQGGMARGR